MADSEKYFTKLVDGQLSVATVAQSGEIIPEESRPGDKYTTALVQTDDGPQLCVKTVDVNGGGGGGGTVDQTYDPTSTNAQSGTAVAEAVAPALKNTATGIDSLTILGTSSSKSYSLNIGVGTTVGTNGSIAIGANSYSGESSLAIGSGSNYAMAAGASGSKSVSLGSFSSATGSHSICIGFQTQASANGAIQLGHMYGTSGTTTNSTANSFQVYSYQMLDGTTGKIPMARLPIVQCTQAEYDALVSGGTVDANTIYCIVPA